MFMGWGAYLAGTLLHEPPSTFLGTSQPKMNPSHPVSTGRRGWPHVASHCCSKKVDNLKKTKEMMLVPKKKHKNKKYT
jgi:hypothetical protein